MTDKAAKPDFSTMQSVIDYYSQSRFTARIADMVEAAGGAAALTREKLSPFDEMHVGGHPATRYLIAALGLRAGQRVLDIGCGIGGAARAVAAETGAHVTGVDLTPDFCTAATMLSELVDMGDAVAFEIGNATALQFRDGTFDAAYTIHAAMNIEDKAAMYREAARVLKSGAVFGIYDIMAMANGDAMIYPAPWTNDRATSFLVSPAEIADILQGAGFIITATESRRDFGITMLEKALPHIADPDFALRIRNLLASIRAEACAPWQIICQKK